MSYLYLFNRLDELSPTAIQMARQAVSQQRLAKVDRMRFEKDKRQSLMAYILFLYAYHAKTGTLLKKPEFMIGQYGKPYIACPEGTRFSISHCELAVCCAISTSEVGVDVQNIIDRDLGILSAFSERERERIEFAEHANREVIRLWTYKESYLKYKGTGLVANLAELDFSSDHDYHIINDVCTRFISYEEDSFIVTVCCDRECLQYQVLTTREVEVFLEVYSDYLSAISL